MVPKDTPPPCRHAICCASMHMVKDPIVLIADPDFEALNRLGENLNDRFYILHAQDGFQILRFFERFSPDVVVVDETIKYGKRGLEELLPELAGRRRARVIILLENGSEQKPRRWWIERGAVDCLPHPTKNFVRLSRLDRRILEVASQKAERAGEGEPQGV